jgi:isopenicillin N synthase-like dioxygenase
MSKLAGTLARVLAEALLGRRPAGERFPEGCDETTCFLRLNRYPACPISPGALGLVPHTDSDFLTVLCQDQQVGGLQLMKGGRWVAVKPIPGTLVVNIGDLFQVRTRAHRFACCIYMCCVFQSPSFPLPSPPLLRADGSVGRDIVVVLVLATYWLLS